MPRARLFDPGSNGACTPADFIAAAYDNLTHSRSFEDEYRARLLPIHAQLQAADALRMATEMEEGVWKIIALAEVSIALRSTAPAHADTALEAMMLEAVLLADDEEELCTSLRSAVFAEVASALVCADRVEEADAWLSRASDNIHLENNPFETVMGIARCHLHRGDHAEAVAAFRSRPGGYSSNVSAFYLPFLETLLSALAQADRDDQMFALIEDVTDRFERYQMLERYVAFRLKMGRPESALAALKHLKSYKNELMEGVAAHAWEVQDLDLLHTAIAAARAEGDPDYIGDFTYWPKWEARIDRSAAKESLAPLLEQGLDPKNCWSGRHWQLSQLIQGIAATGDVPDAIALIPRFNGDDYALKTLEAIGRACIAVGDEEGLQQVVDALCATGEEVSQYEEPAEARAGKLLLEAGCRKDGLALLDALHKKTRGTQRFTVLSRVRCASGDLPGAVRSAKKIPNRGSRDRVLKPIARAYGDAGDLAGAMKVIGEIQERRERGFVATEIMASWAKQQGLYRFIPIC